MKVVGVLATVVQVFGRIDELHCQVGAMRAPFLTKSMLQREVRNGRELQQGALPIGASPVNACDSDVPAVDDKWTGDD